MKLALFSCLIAGITAAANEGALGICAGTDKEFTVGFLNANYPTIPKDLTKGTHWYTHPGLASGICNVKDVKACENVCRSVEGCNYFSMSHTQACYACFIHKTCDAPSTKIGPKYKTYELLATPKAPAGSEFAGNGICHGTDSEFTTAFLNAKYPNVPKALTKGTHWYTHNGLASGICHVRDIAACEKVCDAVEGCNYFSISLTQNCYACFIHKTCDKSRTEIGARYHNYKFLHPTAAPTAAPTTRIREKFSWGTWTLNMKGSRYTHGWKTTVHQGGFHSDTFVVKEIRAGSRSGSPAQVSADSCKQRFRLPGVEALYTGDGQYVRTLSCDNQNARVVSKSFVPNVGAKFGEWNIQMKGSGYTHNWKTVQWTGKANGFMVKEILSGDKTVPAAAQEAASSCKNRFNLPGVEALYSDQGEFIRTLSCDNQDAHVLHAALSEMKDVELKLAVNMGRAQFNAAAQAALKAKIAAQLGVAAANIELKIVDSRRLLEAAAGSLNVIAIVKVPVNAIQVALKKIAAPAFAAATGAEVTEVVQDIVKTSAPTPVPTLSPTAPPTHACPATCKIVMVNGLEVIKTTHKQNGTPFTKHKCYIEGDACKCFCE